MNKLINYLKTYLLFLIVLILYLIIISLIYYFELINYKTLSIVNYIFMILLFFLLGFKVSSLERKKGYLNGFISSVVLIILFVLFSLLTTKISFNSLVYYLSLIVSSIIGGIIGVKEKPTNN